MLKANLLPLDNVFRKKVKNHYDLLRQTTFVAQTFERSLLLFSNLLKKEDFENPENQPK